MRAVTNRDIERAARDEYEAERDINRLARDAHGIPENAIEIIRDRLIFAAKLIERGTKNPAPREYGSAWPPVLREWADLIAQEQGTEKDRERTRVTIQPTARQVTQAEEALAWRRYVTEAQALAALNIWLRCHARRIRSWQREAVRRGFSRETAKRRLARAFFLIALGLARDGIPFEETHR